MKQILPYALVFVLALAASAVFHKFTAGGGEEHGLDDSLRYSKEDIRRLVDSEFQEKREQALRDEQGGRGLVLGPLERELEDLEAQQKDILKQIEGLLNRDPLAGVKAEDVALPDQGRIDEVVAATIRSVADQEQRERQEAADQRRRERDAARRAELEKTLTEKLRLVGDQPARVMAVLDSIDEQRNKFFQDMRAARENGGEVQFDFQGMRENFSKMQEQIDTDVKAILNPDQVTLFEDYKKEAPWTFGGFGGMRGARGRGGAGGGFGRGGESR